VDVRGTSGAARALFAVLLAAVLAVRLLSPAGFMPSFDGGAVTIVACPDYDPAAPMTHHHHGDPKRVHQPCPFAATSAAGTPADTVDPVAAVLVFGTALLFGRAFGFLERHRSRERPPLRGPPLPA
jgi:hypothetical protein